MDCAQEVFLIYMTQYIDHKKGISKSLQGSGELENRLTESEIGLQAYNDSSLIYSDFFF